MKFKKILIIVSCAFVIFLLYWYNDDNLSWQKMIELRAIEVYRPTGTDKFSSEYLYTVESKDTLEKLKNIFNSVEHSSEIKQITINHEVFDKHYSAALDIRPIYTADMNGKVEDSYRLFHFLIENETGHSYLIVVGTGRGYVFNPTYANVLTDLLVT